MGGEKTLDSSAQWLHREQGLRFQEGVIPWLALHAKGSKRICDRGGQRCECDMGDFWNSGYGGYFPRRDMMIAALLRTPMLLRGNIGARSVGDGEGIRDALLKNIV